MPINTAMNNEYTRAREEFDPIFYIIGLVLFMIFFCLFNKEKKKTQTPEEKSEGDPKKTFFTVDDLR